MPSSLSFLEGKKVWCTEKLDGEQCSFHSDDIHARSVSGGNHPSRSMVKSIHGAIKSLIPPHIQIVGENMYAEHSIRYEHLTDYFYVFAVIDKERDVFLSQEDTIAMAGGLGLKMVPTLHECNFRALEISTWREPISPFRGFGPNGETLLGEGYVVRVADEFPVANFQKNVVKFVRGDFPEMIKSNVHWKKKWAPNSLGN